MIIRSKANELLKQLFWKETPIIKNNAITYEKSYYYIGLHSESEHNRSPLPDGSQFDEPTIPVGQTFYDEDGNEVEITKNEYQRVPLESVIGTPSDGMIENTGIIFFNEAEHYAWGKITHFGIFETATSDKPIFYGELKNTDGTIGVTVNKNYIPIFRVGKLKVGLDQDPANPVVAPYEGTVEVA